jgi:hypothetical protein
MTVNILLDNDRTVVACGSPRGSKPKHGLACGRLSNAASGYASCLLDLVILVQTE